MSGYLQRLATNTQKPTSSIHPVVGSFYSVARRDRTLTSGPASEQFAGEHEDRNVFTRNRIAKPTAPPVVQRAREISPNEEQQSQFLMPPAVDVRPSIKPNETTDDALIDEPPQSVPSRSPNLAPLQNEPPAMADRTLNAVIEQLMESGPTLEPRTAIMRQTGLAHRTPEDQGSTLMPKNEVHAAADFAPEVRSLRFAADIGRKRQADGSHRQPASQKEPDEIQIHIGRIEVTAVQVPAPISAPPKLRHPGPSLDEYLQRRGRKTQ